MRQKRAILFGLAVLSVIILAVGSRFRIGSAVPAVPSEAAAVQWTARASSPRELGSALFERASGFAPHLVRVPSRHSTGFRWRTAVTLITAGVSEPVELVEYPGNTAQGMPGVYRGEVPEGSWLVAAARTPEGRLIWTAGVFGGRSPLPCGPLTLDELHFGSPLAEAFAGAAVLDAQRRVVGIVARCPDRLAIIPVDAFSRALPRVPRPSVPALNEAGYHAEPILKEAAEKLRLPAGSLVTAVNDRGPAARAGLRPGDVVVGEPDPSIITVVRGGRRLRLDLTPARANARGMTLERTDDTLRVVAVAENGPADQAGLRAGDVITSAGRTPGRTGETFSLLAANGPVFVVYRRGGISRGARLE